MADQRPLDVVVSDLEALVLHWDQNEDIPPSQVSKAKQIGKELHAIGGMGAMRDAYYQARRINLCANALNVLWNGIGEWMM